MAGKEPVRVHVAFGPSGVGSLRLAFETIGRDEEVLGLADDLSFGPIDVRDVRDRMQWTVDELGFEPDAELEAQINGFWRSVTAVRTEIVAWLSTRHVSEYCGFLELLCRARNAPVSVVNVADVAFTEPDGSPIPTWSTAFAFIPNRAIAVNKLLDRVTRVSPDERNAYEAEWQRLRKENAALRVLTTSGLVSAPITHFDDMIISCVTTRWQRCGTVIGQALGKTLEGAFCQCSSDQLLFSRLLSLVEQNVVEGKNEQEHWSMRDSWVRRRAGSAHERVS